MQDGFRRALQSAAAVSFLVSWNQARAELILPMHNYPLPSDVVTHGFQVYPGVSVDINQQNMTLAVKPSGDLFYVPRLAAVEATDKEVSIAANCSAVETELQSERLLSESRLTLIQLLANSRTLLADLVVTNNSATGSCVQNTALTASQAELVDGLKSDMVAVRANVVATKGEYNSCQLVAATPADCEDDKQALVAALDAFNGLRVKITTEDGKLANLRQAKANSCAEADASAARITKLTSTIHETSKDIADLQDEVVGYIDSMGKDYGGTAAAIISSNSKVQQETLQASNPQYRVRPIEIDKAIFSFLPSVADNNAAISRRTVLGVSVAGAQSADALDGSTATGLMNGEGYTAVLLTLSRLGACSPELVRAAGFLYDFRSYSYLNGIARWNKWATYNKIESTTRRGGLFSSKTTHKVWADMQAGDGFSFVVLNDNSGINAEQMRQELQAALLDRIVKDWAVIESISAEGNVASPVPITHGADTIADGLTGICPTLFCKVGSFVLKGLNSIFGRDVTREEIKKAWNATSEDRFSYTQVYTKHASSATAVTWR